MRLVNLINLISIALITTASMMVGAYRVSAAPADGLAEKAKAILSKNCAGCHGAQNPAFGINVQLRASLVTSKMVIPGKARDSELIQTVFAGSMPKSAPKLSDADIQTLTDWVNAGAPDWEVAAKPGKPAGRASISEATLLKAIVRDLQSANEGERPFLRYYSLANLSNNNSGEVSDETLTQCRGALGKLVNHLSWSPRIVRPKAVNADSTLLRIDLRDYDWTADIWRRIVASYPYALHPSGLSGEIAQIKALSGVDIPYIRADWFVATASVPPLYHDILQLPENVSELEKRLQVNADDNFSLNKVARGGVRNSGVSRNNRVIERHRAAYGAYWKSYDFASNAEDKNIFLNPLNFQEDGGEFIFNLPNGLQGYLIANAKGKRLDEAPIAIVRDRFTNQLDPVVHNGRSCIACHTKGTQPMVNEVRQMLEPLNRAAYDLDKAKQIYVPQTDLDRLFAEDDARFGRALEATGLQVPKQPGTEPVNVLAQHYLADVTTAQAAADAGLDVKEFEKRVSRSSELQKLGFGQLTIVNGGIKRDAWEQYFADMAREVGLGEVVKPTQFRKQNGQADIARKTVRFLNFSGPDGRSVKQDLESWLRRSGELQVVFGGADVTLIGSLTTVGDSRVTLVVKDTAQGISEEVSGASTDLHFLTEQLAEKIHLRLTGRRIGVNIAQEATLPNHSGVAKDPALQLQQAFQNGGPVHVALSVDRGPGGVYRGGESVMIRFKVDRDCFVQLKNIDCQGNVVNLFPNRLNPSFQVRAGEVYEIADSQGPLFVVDPKGAFGEETIVAIATLQEETLPAPRSKTLADRDSVGAQKFSQNLIEKAKPGKVSTAVVRFSTVP